MLGKMGENADRFVCSGVYHPDDYRNRFHAHIVEEDASSITKRTGRADVTSSFATHFVGRCEGTATNEVRRRALLLPTLVAVARLLKNCFCG